MLKNIQTEGKKRKYSKMELFPEERRKKIIEFIQKSNRVTVTKLVEILGVSDVTVRRDLSQLESEGLLRRTHGGAILTKSTGIETSFAEREIKFLAEKERIGKFAAQYVRDGETVMIDGGSTTLQLVKNLKHKKDLIVVTNAPNLAMELQENDSIEVILTGGNLRKQTLMLVGPVTIETITKFRADKAILGISAISVKEGLFTVNPLEAEVKKYMINCSEELIIVADSSKLGKVAFTYVTSLARVSKLITDNKISSSDIKAIEDQEVEILIAE